MFVDGAVPGESKDGNRIWNSNIATGAPWDYGWFHDILAKRALDITINFNYH